jgi:23S rRNA (guanosine2251-2'-O)-methyltransferase
MRERRSQTTGTSTTVWIAGVNQSLDALKGESRAIQEIVVSRDDRRVDEILEIGRRLGIPIRREPKDGLTALVGHGHHQGIALRAGQYAYTPLESILERPAGEREPLIVLDSILDPHNLGAILRSACFLGAKGVILPKDRSAKVTDAAIRVAAGATAYLPVVQVTNLARTLDALKEAGFWAVGLDLHTDRSLYEVELMAPLVLVVGGEQKGLRPLVRDKCDLLVKIPAHGQLDSLNAATACAISLAEAQRQRLQPGSH